MSFRPEAARCAASRATTQPSLREAGYTPGVIRARPGRPTVHEHGQLAEQTHHACPDRRLRRRRRRLAHMFNSYEDRIKILELDANTPLADRVDIVMYDSFAQPQADHSKSLRSSRTRSPAASSSTPGTSTPTSFGRPTTTEHTATSPRHCPPANSSKRSKPSTPERPSPAPHQRRTSCPSASTGQGAPKDSPNEKPRFSPSSPRAEPTTRSPNSSTSPSTRSRHTSAPPTRRSASRPG